MTLGLQPPPKTIDNGRLVLDDQDMHQGIRLVAGLPPLQQRRVDPFVVHAQDLSETEREHSHLPPRSSSRARQLQR